ncbi:MAG: iron ABC transporter permease [Enterobacteriaceae bacterium]|nr:iron ABC transporter permease [Enterobacteriaceae bacterium]
MQSKNYQRNIFILLVVIALVIAVLSLCLGKFTLAPARVCAMILSPLRQLFTDFTDFTDIATDISDIEQQIIWTIRIPRILMAFCAGAALALCGAALQGVFHNPLVDPHIIGVTSGAAFGGTLAILLGLSPYLLTLSTFSFGLLALFLVYFIAHLIGHGNRLILVLAGVILSGFFSALVSLLQYMADTEEKLPSIVFWLLGSFATASWHKLLMLLIPLLVAGYFLLRLRWRINLLSLGDCDAKALGISVTETRWLILVLCALIVAAQVAVSGSIGWIGLVIPHFARMIVGTDHRYLLPASLLLGGSFMVIVDDLARTLTSAEIPVGIITALLGAPLFTVLLVKNYKRKIQ